MSALTPPGSASVRLAWRAATADGRAASQEKSSTGTLAVAGSLTSMVSGGFRAQVGRREVAGALSGRVGAEHPEPAPGAPGEPAQEVRVGAALHQRVLVVGVRRGVLLRRCRGRVCTRRRWKICVGDVDVG